MYEPEAHIRVGEIIRRHSTNPASLLAMAAELVPWSRVSRVLDLGCGYGAFYEALAGRLSPAVEVTGIDRNERNGPFFLERVRRTGAAGEFQCRAVDRTLPFPPGCCDLVLALFSLYFFVDLLPVIRNLVRPGGTFLTITHCSQSLARLNGLVDDPRIREPLVHFNAENGEAILAQHFSTVEQVRYENSLHFPAGELEELFYYLDFKRPAWLSQERAQAVKEQVRLETRESPLVLCKDDVIFRCHP